ncbi:MAG: hypothetical protein ACI810_002210 [Gammaproteobacteria bacterium]|jgi:hypothetical protein
MTDFIGTENLVVLQQRILARQSLIDGDINLVNGGRLMLFLDPDLTGWNTVRRYAEEDQLIGFPAVEEEKMIPLIHRYLGVGWKTPTWLCLTGGVDRVLHCCRDIVKSNPLPTSWNITTLEQPDSGMVDEIQALNSETGVLPYPAYYMRSEALPVLTVCILNADNDLVATASVADRYNLNSRLGGYAFAGNVSVSTQCRGKGLGKFVNALALIESQKRFNWNFVTEQAALDNPISRAMIISCGLDDTAGLVTIAASNFDERITR